MNENELKRKAKAYALKNAVAYEGKCQAGSVISALFHEGLEKEEMKKYSKVINEVVKSVNSLTFQEQEKEFKKLIGEISHREGRVGLQELPNIPKTGVIMRFRPAPSGPLHVGHIISNMVNSLYVKKYGGKFYVIIDDTNPEETLPELYSQIKKDCDWIFGNVYKYLNASDNMKKYYEYAERLIQLNSAYVCTCPGEKFKNLADKKKPCPCRNMDLTENMKRWNKMLDKKGYKEGEAVLRFKTPQELEGLNHPNPAMRDFPLARINLHKHPKQGLKYKVWPLMNLSVSVDDIELKTSHIIRGKDHRDNAKRQEMIYTVLGLKDSYPWTFFMGRIKFKDIVLSKRKINAAIKEGKYTGIEDENLPTLASLRKRGYKPGAFAKFAEERGLNEVDKVISQKDFFQIIDNYQKEQE